MQTGKRTRKQYDEAYKLDAVALVNEQGYKLSEVARRLGITANMLSRWKQEFMQESTGQRLTADEREELTRLRWENRELKLEADILKKATAYFAKHTK